VVRELASLRLTAACSCVRRSRAGADGDVDLESLSIEAEASDDVALLARFLEHLANAAADCFHAAEVLRRLGDLLLRRE